MYLYQAQESLEDHVADCTVLLVSGGGLWSAMQQLLADAL